MQAAKAHGAGASKPEAAAAATEVPKGDSTRGVNKDEGKLRRGTKEDVTSEKPRDMAESTPNAQ